MRDVKSGDIFYAVILRWPPKAALEGWRRHASKHDGYSGFNPASISLLRASRNGGSASFSPSLSSGSSVAKPAPSVAISNSTPLGDIDSYVVYVGFDPTAATPEKKKPAAKPKPKARSVAKPKQS